MECTYDDGNGEERNQAGNTCILRGGSDSDVAMNVPHSKVRIAENKKHERKTKRRGGTTSESGLATGTSSPTDPQKAVSTRLADGDLTGRYSQE